MKKTFLLVLFSFCFSYSQSEFIGYNQLILSKNYNLEMVPIKGGEFLMGSPLYEKNRLADEGPVRKVKIDSFWMASGLYYYRVWHRKNNQILRSFTNWFDFHKI